MAECPAVPEMVVMGVGHGRIETAIEDVLSVEGVKAIITPGLGNEAGHEGPPISERISARVREAGIAMVGPNCMGIATPGSPSPWIGSLHTTFVPGPVATLAHSGSIGEILVSLGPRVGFRTMVSSGNETVVDAADFVAWFAQDPATRVIGLFLEAVRRPEAFEEALRRVSEAGKVAIVMKVGASEMGAEAALAHTGALVGSDRSFSAMLRHYNAIRVDDFGDWIEHLEVFGREKPPRGRGSASSRTRAARASFADKAEQAGIPLSLFPDKLRAAISAEFPNFLHVGNPSTAGRSTTTGSSSRVCSRCLPSRASSTSSSRRSTIRTGCGAPSGTWRGRSPRTCGTPWTAPASSRP
jgi:acetyltransferase